LVDVKTLYSFHSKRQCTIDTSNINKTFQLLPIALPW